MDLTFLTRRAILAHLTNFCSTNSTKKTHSQKHINYNLAVKMDVGGINKLNNTLI